MASFFAELWESVFTPGPTPTILKATNASFAALQVVLLSLLAATYSVHFAILSVLCAGLWWSINWFASELTAAQALEKEEEERLLKKRKHKEWTPVGAGGIAGSDDSDTEVEGRGVKRGAGGGKAKRVAAAAAAEMVAETVAETAADVEPVEQGGELRQRGEASSEPGTQSSASTEDEWEKVSEDGKDKDK